MSSRPGTAVSDSSTLESTALPQALTTSITNGRVSTLPEDKLEESLEEKREETAEAADNEWAQDPINPRNWSSGKKWTAVAIVRISHS
jgi:hypothetical protein